MKRVTHRAETLEIAPFARDAASLSGELPVRDLPRLAQAVLASAHHQVVHWALRGELRRGVGGAQEPWLILTGQVQVDLQCQRCLGTLGHDLRIERQFQFVPGEEAAAELDAEVEHPVLALKPRIDALTLLEDELLLDLPFIPRHEACTAAAPAGDSDAPAHPFAVLAALRQVPPASSD